MKGRSVMDRMLPSQEEIWLKHYAKDAKEKSNIIEDNKTLWEVLEERIFEYENIPAIDYYGRKIRRLEFRLKPLKLWELKKEI